MKKVVFIATKVDGHLDVFHIPYMKLFHDKGFEVHTIANGNKILPYADKHFDIKIKRSPFNFENIKALIQIIKIMKSEKYCFVTCHTPMGGVLGRIASNTAKIKPVMYTAHGFHFYKGAPFINIIIYKNIEKFLAHYTDVLITINNEDFEAAKKFKLRSNGNLYFIPGIGVNTDKIKDININKSIKKNELKISEDKIIVLIVGELIKRKNILIAIKAIKEIKNEKTVLLICGKGAMEIELKNLAKNLDIENKVIFAGFRNDISEIMKVSDIFFFPSKQEGLSVAVMEAMASSLPVICSNIRGNVDLIDNEKGGYLLPSNDYKKFAEAIDNLSFKPELRKQMGEYNSSQIEKYSLKNVLKIMEDIYDKTLNS